MALQMSPVDAHSENQPLCHRQSAALLPESAAQLSSGLEPPQCQLLECFRLEQVPLPTNRNPIPPSSNNIEQRVSPGGREGALDQEVMMASGLGNPRCNPGVMDFRGGAASEVSATLDVPLSSVINSSTADPTKREGSVHPGTHESHKILSASVSLVDNVEQIGSATASSSASNSLNDAQKDSSDAKDGSSSAWPARSFNQSTSTFSGETNSPSATYADSVVSCVSTSAHHAPVAAVTLGEEHCDSKEPLFTENSSKSGALLHYPPTGPASNRFWGIPQGAGLRGGAGETSLNNGAGSWAHPPATGGWVGGAGGGTGTNSAANQVQGQWNAASTAGNQRSSAASQGPSGAAPPGSSGPQQVSGQQQLPTGAQPQQQTQGAWDTSKNAVPGNAGQQASSSPNQGVWAAQAAKNVPNQATNTNPSQDINPLNLQQGGNSGGNSGGVSGSGPATPNSGKPDPLANYRDIIYSQDGWGGNQVNQDTAWDVPTSPEPKEVPLWKQTASNGTEVWEVNLRNGGQAPPPIAQTKAPWGSHTPATNLGGTWGEDDDTAEPSSMWTGVPSNNGPTNWAPNPMAGPINSGPMGGPSAGPSNTSTIAPGIASGNGMWGGPKKESEWTGTSSMQAGPGGWGDVRPTQRMGIAGVGPSGPENMAMGPGAPSHWPGPQNKAAPQWAGNVPTKDIKPSGWDEHSPPAQKRPVHNYDDGTSVWGNPAQMHQAGSGVCRWQDMPTPNMAGGRGMQQSGPPPGRMPPGPGMKKDISWTQSRNGSWGDGVGDNANMNNMWMEDKPAGASWNEPPQTPTPWANSKPKTPTTPSWGETDETLSWGQPPKQGPKPFTKEMIWASKQFRILSDMGFKKEDVENVLRNCNMVMEDALETLRSGRMGMFGDDHGSGYDPMGPHAGGPYPPGPRYNPSQQMPFVHPGGSGAPHHLLNNPGAPGMGMNPNAYKILQPTPPPTMPPQVSQPQIGRNISRVDPGMAGGAGAGSQPSPTQLRLLVQQIQMAVQAGHLNPQILNQPLAPQTLVLLNQLLQQIKLLQQLGQQHNMALSRPGQGPMGNTMLQLVPQMNKTKQQIASLQQQIAAQQALYVKQQSQLMNQQPPGAPPGQPSDLFKVDAGVHGIESNLGRMNLQDAPQSRLSQWKFGPPLDKDLDLGMSEFSRAPGSSGGAPGSMPGNAKPPLGSSLSSPNINPVLSQETGAWSSLTRSQSETAWPDSGQDMSTPISGAESKESWNSAAGTSSYAGSISDLVPEFEPGKPWKGPQIKTADDDPTLTPGTFAMSGLSNETDVYSNNASKGGQGSTKASPPPAVSGGSGSTGESGFSTLGLSNSTWSFNPTSASSSAAQSTTTPYSTAKLGPKSSWSDAPPPSDPWSAPNKPRGPPPGIGGSSAAGPKAAGARDWSTGSRSPWPGSTTTGSGGSWGSSLNGASSWLMLRNLTPQIDGSTLKTLCIQHGPLHNFHLYLNHGVALVRYSSGEEAAKAQSALNNCVLGNTTIYADLANESDVQNLLQQLGLPAQQQQNQQPQQAASAGWGVRGSTPGSGSNGGGGGGGSTGTAGGNVSKPGANAGDNWGSGAGGPSSSPWSTGPNSVWSTTGLERDLRATPSSLNASLNSFLPGDLLGNESM